MEHYTEILDELTNKLETIYVNNSFRYPVYLLLPELFRARAEMDLNGVIPDLEFLYDEVEVMAKNYFDYYDKQPIELRREPKQRRSKKETTAAISQMFLLLLS